MPTLAFSNTGNYWKTRYTFEPSCYSNQDANLISYAAIGAGFLQFNGWSIEPQPETVDENTGEVIPAVVGVPAGTILPFIHNQNGNEGPQYYGNDTGGSGIAIVFNENVSANKMFKSISLEGSSNLQQAGFSLLQTNDTTVPGDSTLANIRPLNFKGGIVYADLGRGQENSQANIRAVATFAGMVENIEVSDDLIATSVGSGVFTIDVGAGASIQAGDPIYFVNNDGNVLLNGSYVDPGEFPWNGTPEFVASLIPGTGTVLFNNQIGFTGPAITDFTEAGLDGPITILTRGNTAAYGKSVQGQYATLRIVFGNQDYELHAINAYYEPNTLDHRETRTAANQLQRLLGQGKRSK